MSQWNEIISTRNYFLLHINKNSQQHQKNKDWTIYRIKANLEKVNN